MSGFVHVERDGDVLLMVVNNPPINAGSRAVRTGLLAAISDLQTDSSLVGGVIIGAGTTFVAGSDLKEFGQPLEDPQLPAIIAAIENCGKPVVAALHGAALGGGFELALGCDARIALTNTVVGLPEVSLGIIPGAGGTQRLPRVVGVPMAMQLVGSGERVVAGRALDLGLVDEVVESKLRTAAIDRVRSMRSKKRRLRDLEVPPCSAEALQAARAAVVKAGKGRPAVLAAVEAVASAAVQAVDDGLREERRVFQQLRTSREAFALRHQFFAERDSAKHPSLDGVQARAVSRLAVIGAGTMGTGIAIAALDAGYQVVLLEQDAVALGRGVERIHEHYASRVHAGKIQAPAAASTQERLFATLEWTTLADVDVVIEAVFEDLAVKREVFTRIDAHARPGAVLASNTSYLDLDAIAASTQRPQDVIGLHFFSPAHVMKLLEVVRGRDSAADAVVTGLAIGKRLNKRSVLTGNAFGFIGNRIYAAYRRQCEFMLEDGAYPEQVDEALQAFGFAMGPFKVADLSGLDIAWRMRQAQAATRVPSDRYVSIPDRLCEAGRLGRKAGAGYYLYAKDAKVAQSDPAVYALIEQCRQEKGIAPRAMSQDDVVRRAMLAMVNEAALLLAEGVAERATDIDVVSVNGFGFPRWEGGPVFWGRERGATELAQDMVWLADISGPGFRQASTQQLSELLTTGS
jgi:3-hydroxyacyl-CoA dehydrogenase